MQVDIRAQGGAGAGAPEGVSGQNTEQRPRSVEYHIAYCAYGATGEGETLFMAVSGTQEHARSAFKNNVPEYWKDHMTLDVIGDESSAATRSIACWIPQAALDLIASCPPGTNFYFATMHCNLS
ncbi:hypothetical protein [Thermomonas sp.]|uniref:hypothetical protein n=1 Tax=Thermomonas sp. TaxID=1971895 RepID=UPI00391B01C0